MCEAVLAAWPRRLCAKSNGCPPGGERECGQNAVSEVLLVTRTKLRTLLGTSALLLVTRTLVVTKSIATSKDATNGTSKLAYR